MSYQDRTRQLLLEGYNPLPSTVVPNCPNIHPDDFPPLDPMVPAFYVEVAQAWHELMLRDPSAVATLGELLWDLTWKAEG